MRGSLLLARLGLHRGSRRAMVLMLVVIALAAAALIAATTVAGGAADRIDGAFARAHGADFVVYTDVSNTDAIVSALADDTDVHAVATPVLARATHMRVGDRDETVEHRIATVGDADAIGHPVVRDGRLPRTPDEVALDAGVAVRFGIAVGDEVTFTDAQGSPVEFRVAGTAYDFADCFYPTCDPGRSWMSVQGQSRLGPPTTAIIGVSLDDPARAAAVEQRLASIVGDDRFGADSWLDTRGDLLAETDFFAVFLSAFGLFALIASAIVIAAGTTARAIAHRRRSGICKAVGATPRQLVVAQVLEHVSVAAVGALLGWLAAGLVTPHLRVGALRIIGSGQPTLEPGRLAVVTAAIVAVVAIVTLLAAWRAAHEPAVDAIRDAGRNGSSRGGLAAPAAVEWGVRSFTARPFRSATAVAASVIAVVAAIVSLSINHSMDYLLAHPALSGDPWDVSITPSAADTSARVSSRLDSLPQVGHWYTTRDETAGWNGERLHVRLIGGDAASAGYVIGGGRAARLDGEAVVGYGLVNEDGVRVGDTMALQLHGRTMTLRVVGWYRESEDSGRIVQVPDNASIAGDHVPTYAVVAAPGTSTGALAEAVRALGAEMGGEVEVNRSDGTMLAPFRVAMASMTMLVAAVAVAHLLATALATARERTRSTAILRAVGCDTRQLTLASAVSGAVAALCAAVVGVPIGLWLQHVLGDEITKSIGVGPGASPNPPALPTAIVIASLMVLAAGTVTLATVRTSRRAVARVLATD